MNPSLTWGPLAAAWFLTRWWSWATWHCWRSAWMTEAPLCLSYKRAGDTMMPDGYSDDLKCNFSDSFLKAPLIQHHIRLSDVAPFDDLKFKANIKLLVLSQCPKSLWPILALIHCLKNCLCSTKQRIHRGFSQRRFTQSPRYNPYSSHPRPSLDDVLSSLETPWKER